MRIDYSSVQNTLFTSIVASFGYLLPFFGEHLRVFRSVKTTITFLLSHTYFHYYLTTLALTLVLMSWVWYYIEVQSLRINYKTIGVIYGMLFGISFSIFYIFLGKTVYSFSSEPIYIIILVALGITVGIIIGLLRSSNIIYSK